MKTKLYSALLLGVLSSSCAKDDDCKTTDLLAVKFVPITDNYTTSRAVKLNWSQGDQIAIFSDISVKKDGTNSTASITYTRGASEGVWTPPSANEEWYFANATQQHTFYAYYPVGTATSYTSVAIPDISGQNGTKTVVQLKEENDFMRGTSWAIRGDEVELQMYRVFAIVYFNIALKQNAFANNQATLTSMTLASKGSLPLVNPSSAVKGTVNLSNGTITCAGGLTSVTLTPPSGVALTTTAVPVPVKIFAHNATMQVQFTVNGKTSPAITLNTTNFVGGRVYSYAVTLDADLLNVNLEDPMIFDWIDVAGNPIVPVIPN